VCVCVFQRHVCVLPSTAGGQAGRGSASGAQGPVVYGSLPNLKECHIKWRDQRGYERSDKLQVQIGTDWADTSRNIGRCIDDQVALEERGKRALGGGPPESDAPPELVAIHCGIDFYVTSERGCKDGYKVACRALHVYVRDHISAQFDTALDMLAHGKHDQAFNLANSLRYARAPEHVSDLNEDFTNQALAMCITTVSQAAQGVELMNREPDQEESRQRALVLLMEASVDIDECLAGTCKSKDYVAGARAPGLPWISSTARAGAGMTLRDNMTQLWQTILDMKEAIHGYIEQNPADD
jgi:hypothetical protein